VETILFMDLEVGKMWYMVDRKGVGDFVGVGEGLCFVGGVRNPKLLAKLSVPFILTI
jgi:hypothetical protein